MNLPVKIAINGDFDEQNPFQLTRVKIDTSAMYLSSIFNVLKLAARANDDNPESNFADDVANLCTIGQSISDSLLDTSLSVLSWESDFESGIQEGQPKTFNDNLQKLSVIVSEVLQDNQTPDVIQNALRGAVTDIFNTLNSQPLDYETTPEYIENVLRGAINEQG